MHCDTCKLHASECVCAGFLGEFTYLEDGKGKTVARSHVLQLRKEGLAAFKEDFEKYLGRMTPGQPTNAVASMYRWAMKVLEAAPLYFWVIPSSSTGKYHPECSQGEQGLVKHVLAVTYYAHELSRTFNLSPLQTAAATVAAAIHDLCKYGLEYNPRYFGVHECLVRVKIGPKGANLIKELSGEWVEQILAAVETHNGALTTGEWTAFRMAPQSDIARVVHLADYVASRKKFEYTV